jgi:hypothetical protein
MNFIEKMLIDNFLKVPQWARNITYLALLVLTIYMSLLPKEIGGAIEMDLGNGVNSAVDSVDVSYVFNAHYISAKSGKAGQWTLPLISNAIKSYEVRFSLGNTYSKVIISAEEIFMKKEIAILYDSNRNMFYRPISKDEYAAAKDVMAGGSFALFSKAYAQTEGLASRNQGALAVFEKEKIQIEQAIQDIQSKQSIAEKIEVIENANSTYGLKLENSMALISTEVDAKTVAEKLSIDSYLDSLKSNQSAAFLYYGELKENEGWQERFFRLGTGVEDGIPSKGDLVIAQASVNMRSGYIEYGWRGWVNKPSLGVTKGGQQFIVEETQRFGPYLWIKGYQAE